MTIARITEISSVSRVSFQDAIVQGVERANKTLKNVKGAWIKDQEVTIDNGKVTEYKVILKVTFVLFDELDSPRVPGLLICGDVRKTPVTASPCVVPQVERRIAGASSRRLRTLAIIKC